MKIGSYELGPGGQGLYIGDSKVLSLEIPDESIDLIFCDPVYQNIEDYEWLAETAARVLKPDSACLAFCSNVKQKETRMVMDKHMSFVMPLNYVVVGKTMALYHYHTFVWTTPCLWYHKGRALPKHWISDTCISSQAIQANTHKWAKGSGVFTRWMEAFTNIGDVVFDPFCGGGTVPRVASQIGRKWIAFEIDPDTAHEARNHISTYQIAFTQPVRVTQTEMFEHQDDQV